jgi:transcriptional regulator with XRE-family HTH domain
MTKGELQKSIGQSIRQFREQRKISQQELAAICNFEKSNMSRIEAGRSNITLFTLYTISSALDVEMQQLLGSIK